MKYERYERLLDAEKKANKTPKLMQEISSKQKWGRNNPLTGFIRESDEPIVAMKWGNAHGAKGLYYYKSFQLRRRPD